VNKGGTSREKSKSMGKIFGIALVLVMVKSGPYFRVTMALIGMRRKEVFVSS
jgi:hypothetical protein